MNVREEILKEKIDPFLTPERLAVIARLVFAEHSDGIGRSSDPGGEKPKIETAKVFSGGCWNRVIEVSFASGEAGIVYKISPEEGDEKIIREYRVLGYFASRTSPLRAWPSMPSSREMRAATAAISRLPSRVAR